MEGTLKISIADEEMILHPYGALYWVRMDMVLIADLHIGKIEHFRKSGLAVPAGIVEGNFKRLDKVLDTFKPAHIYFLGDLFHSKKNSGWDRFFEWMETVSVPVNLILGNHDRHDLKSIPKGLINMISDLDIDRFLLSHHPEEHAGKFNICGHIHPGVVIRGRGKSYAKSACFAVEENRLVLPAFGVFTGLHPVDLEKCAAVYVCAADEVLRLK